MAEAAGTIFRVVTPCGATFWQTSVDGVCHQQRWSA